MSAVDFERRLEGGRGVEIWVMELLQSFLYSFGCVFHIHDIPKLYYNSKQCSGDLLLVADGFSCKQCDRTIQEADLARELVVDGETYGCVKSFCHPLMEMVEWILLL